MKSHRSLIIAVAAGVVICACGASGKTLRIVSYNIDCSDQSSDNNITGATHSLPTVIQAIGLHHIGTNAQPVDVLGVEELQTTTLANFVAQLNAIYGPGAYAFDPTTDPNTGGGPDGLIYRTNTVQVVSARAMKTGQIVLLQANGTYTSAHSPGGGVNGVTRAPMVYQLRPVGSGSNADFYMYVSHARSTSDDSVGDARYAEAQAVRSDAKYKLPAGAHVLYSGDWNLFSGSGENAYKCLTGQTTSDGIDWSDTSAIWANTNQTQAYDPTSKTNPPTTTTWANVSTDGATYLYGDSTASLTSRIDIQLPNALMFAAYNSQGGTQLAPDTSDPFDSSNFPSAKYPYAFEVFGNNGTTPRSSSPTSSANHSLDDLTNTVPSAATVYADIKLTGSGSTFTGSDHYPIIGDYIVVEAGAPSITTGPASRTNNLGTTATFTVSAIGAAPLSYQWRKNTTNLPNAGNISGVMTTTLTLTNVAFADAGNYTVVVSNSLGMIISPVAVLTVLCPVITVGPASLPSGTAGTSYNQSNTASGGIEPYTFVVTSGSVPTGLNLNTNSGVINGTPTTVGTNNFIVTATDANSCSGSSSYTVAIACPVITVGPANLANGTAGTAYDQTNTANGSVGLTTFAVTSGSLPAGLDLNTNAGVISGTPTIVGTNTFIVTATDANGCSGSSSYTVLIGCPAITIGPANLADGTTNASYLQTNTASGGIAPYTFVVTSGSLPAGLNLNTNSGVVSGMPTSVGTNTFTVTATDTNGCTGNSSYTMVIANGTNTVGPISLFAQGFGTNGNFQLTLSSTTNTGFGIQASTNLADWTSIGSGVTDTNGFLSFEDTNAIGFSSRFYRAYWRLP